MTDIFKDDTPQTVAVVIVNSAWNPVTSITTPAISFFLNDGTSHSVVTSNLTYTGNVGVFEVVIPSALITATGKYRVYITGDNIQPSVLDGKIYTMGAMTGAVTGTVAGTSGLTKDYTVDHVNKTIQFGNTSIDKRDVVRIRGVSSNLDIYNQDSITHGKNNITLDSVTPGLFHYDYPISEDEILKIWLEP